MLLLSLIFYDPRVRVDICTSMYERTLILIALALYGSYMLVLHVVRIQWWSFLGMHDMK
jgi:hypothetical protein